MGILSIFGSLVDPITSIVEKAVVDKDKVREIEYELQVLLDQADARYHEQMMGQMEINKEEAKNGSIFVAGWRPAVGWVCAAGLACQVILLPLIEASLGWTASLDTELLILTMSGMLGIGAMRSYEKVKGVSTNDFTDTPNASKPPTNLLPDDIPWMK